MPSLSKRPNGLYYLYFFDATKHPKRKGVSTGETNRRKAENAARRIEEDVRAGRLVLWPQEPAGSPSEANGLASSPKPESPVEGFLASRSNLSPATQRHYANVLGRLVRFLGSGERAASASSSELLAFIRSTPARPVTQHHYRRHLRAFYRWLIASGFRDADPAEGLRLERAPAKHARFLSPADVEAFCEAAERHPPKRRKAGAVDVAVIVRANVLMGLRLAELVNLRWADVDLAGERLYVRCRDGFTTKSGAERVVPVSAPLRQILEQLPRRAAYVFVTAAGEKINPTTLSKTFRRVASWACLDGGICFHSTHHTAASWLAQRGVSVEAIRMMLGHSTIAVTERYMHLSPEAFTRQIQQALNAASASQSEP